MELDKAIKERHSVRRFKSGKKPNYREIVSILEAGTKAPLAGNIYSVKYILVTEKEKIKAIAEASQQDFIAETDFVIVICSDKKDLERNYYERGKIYARHNAGAAIENMLLKITELGLTSCWVGAFSDDMVKRILGIPENIDIEALLPVGYEFEKKKQPRKPALDDVMFFDTWKNKFMGGRAIIPRSRT